MFEVDPPCLIFHHNLHRSLTFVSKRAVYAIAGGSEEIMLDLSMRQSLRVHKALGMKL